MSRKIENNFIFKSYVLIKLLVDGIKKSLKNHPQIKIL